MTDQRISIVVPCRNESDPVQQLLDELRRQDTPIHEVIVVDNASTDDVVEALDAYRRRHPDFPLRVVTCTKVGIPAALNAGIRAASGDVIVRFDAHSCPTDHYVRQAVATLRETGAGVVGGVWEIAPGRNTVVALAIARAVSHPMGAGDAAYRTGRTFAERRPVDTVPFGCFLRKTWEDLGEFNERLLTNEDYEFNYRVRQSGRAVLLDPNVRSVYYARATFGALIRQYFRYGWWKAQMLKSHPKSLRWRQAVPAVFVATVAALALASAFSVASQVMLGGLLLVYFGALTAASFRISGGRRTWRIFPVLPLVFATIHFAWGGGVLANLLTLGRLPLGSAAAASDPEDDAA